MRAIAAMKLLVRIDKRAVPKQLLELIAILHDHMQVDARRPHVRMPCGIANLGPS